MGLAKSRLTTPSPKFRPARALWPLAGGAGAPGRPTLYPDLPTLHLCPPAPTCQAAPAPPHPDRPTQGAHPRRCLGFAARPPSRRSSAPRVTRPRGPPSTEPQGWRVHATAPTAYPSARRRREKTPPLFFPSRPSTAQHRAPAHRPRPGLPSPASFLPCFLPPPRAAYPVTQRAPACRPAYPINPAYPVNPTCPTRRLDRPALSLPCSPPLPGLPCGRAGRTNGRNSSRPPWALHAARPPAQQPTLHRAPGPPPRGATRGTYPAARAQASPRPGGLGGGCPAGLPCSPVWPTP